jgi:hypothetical protein
MFKALFAFIGFGLAAAGFWVGNLAFGLIGIAFLAFVIWWIRSSRSI